MIIKQRCYEKLCDRRRICDCDVMIPFDPILFELTVVYRRFNLAMQYMDFANSTLTLSDSSRNMQVTSQDVLYTIVCEIDSVHSAMIDTCSF